MPIDTRGWPMALVSDVSDELGERNAANRLYRLPSGRVVKVKCYEQPRVPGQPEDMRVFMMRASLCDPAGAADVETIGQRHMGVCRIMPGGETVEAQLEETRRSWALWAETRQEHFDADVVGAPPLDVEGRAKMGLPPPAEPEVAAPLRAVEAVDDWAEGGPAHTEAAARADAAQAVRSDEGEV